MCKKAPVVYIEPKDIWKKEVTEKKAKKIFEKYLL
jgi:(2Fe-2S) ferredoxin